MFAFVLVITEINASLMVRYFTFRNASTGEIDPACPTLLKFCRLLAWQLIRNSLIVDEENALEDTT